MTARKAVAKATNIVPLRPENLTPSEIEAEVLGKQRESNGELRALMLEVAALAREAHDRRVQDGLMLGRRMTRTTLDAWIDMGQRLLANGGAR